MRDPFLAGILSLLIPGVGQLYNGRILAGILWLIITPGMWIGTAARWDGFATLSLLTRPGLTPTITRSACDPVLVRSTTHPATSGHYHQVQGMLKLVA